MKTLFLLSVLTFITIVGIAFAQSTAGQGYPVILSTTTTGAYACPAGATLPCVIPIDSTHPLPTTTTGG